MSEFTIRSESVDVEQIMKQIRSRILEKRGADYTEDQIQELASVRLEKFLEPKNLRSDLLEQFRKSRPAIPEVSVDPPVIQPPYVFDDQTLFTSHRGPMRLMRRLMRPLLKLFFNPNTLNQILHTQAQFNVDLMKREARLRIETRQQQAAFAQSRAEWNVLYYEVLHNLVLETTRMGIEVQNLRMKLESLSSRLDFSERRVRALEGVVQYRPEIVQAPPPRREEQSASGAYGASGASGAGASGAGASGAGAQGATGATGASRSSSSDGYVPSGGSNVSQPGPSGQGTVPGDASRRRRRRRRGRRGGANGPNNEGAPGASGASGALSAPGSEGAVDEPDDFDGPDELEGPDAFEAAGSEAPSEPEARSAPAAPAAPTSSDDNEQ